AEHDLVSRREGARLLPLSGLRRSPVRVQTDLAEVVSETRFHVGPGLRIERLTGRARHLRIYRGARLSPLFSPALLALGPASRMPPASALPLQHSAGDRRALGSSRRELSPQEGTSAAFGAVQRKSASLTGRPIFWSSVRAAARTCAMVTGWFF